MKFVGVEPWEEGCPVIDLQTADHGLITLNNARLQDVCWLPPATLLVRLELHATHLEIRFLEVGDMVIRVDQPIMLESSRQVGDLLYHACDDGGMRFSELELGDLRLDLTCVSISVR